MLGYRKFWHGCKIIPSQLSSDRLEQVEHVWKFDKIRLTVRKKPWFELKFFCTRVNKYLPLFIPSFALAAGYGYGPSLRCDE